MATNETVKKLSTKAVSTPAEATTSIADLKYKERRHSSLKEPLSKNLMNSKNSSSPERKTRDRRNSSLTSSVVKQLSLNDKNNNRIAINLPVAKVGADIKQKEKPFLGRKVTGRDRNVKYWAWIEEIDIDTLDGLTEDVKEKLRAAATSRKLTDEDEEDTKKNGLHRQVNVTQYLQRVCSEVLPLVHQVRLLEERTSSEPSIIASEESILDRIKIWHPSGFAKSVRPILKGENNRRFLNVCFQQKHKFISPIVSTEKKSRRQSQPALKKDTPVSPIVSTKKPRKQSLPALQKGTPDSDSSDQKQSKLTQPPLKRKYSESSVKPERLVSRISIVNMSFQGAHK